MARASQEPRTCSTSPARVLFLTHTSELGGAEIALLNVVRYLSAAVRPIVVLGADGALGEHLRPIAETHVIPMPVAVAKTKKDTLGFATLFRFREIAKTAAYVWRLCGFIKKHNIDLVHTNSLKADVIGGMAARLSRRPVVWHVRDRIENDYLPRSVVGAFRFLCRVVPTYVIANSAATLKTLRLGNANSGTSIPSGIDLRGRMSIVHDGTSAETPRRLNASCQIFRIGLIGRISPWKGQHIFIQAAAQVSKKFPRAQFVIIGAALFGEAEYEEEVRRMPGRMGIEDLVQFAGFRSDVKEAIAELDLVVHASTTGEPFGQVIIEGMAAAKPVVATNGGGVPEIVEHGKTGLLVPMGDISSMADAICKILGDPVMARDMGLRGQERVTAHFTVENTARKIEIVYAEILGKRTLAGLPSTAPVSSVA